MASEHPTSTSETHATEISSFSVLLSRVFWLMVGPLLLIASAWGIASNVGWVTGWDLFFVAVVACMIAGRWYELRSGSATTVDGDPATPADYRRWRARLVIVGIVGWIGANLYSNVIA